jgi:hypothetical protein
MLKELNVEGKNTRNERLQDLLSLHGGDVNKVKNILKGQLTGGAGVLFKGIFNLVGAARGTSFTKMIAELNKPGVDRNKTLGTMRAIAAESAGAMGISEEGAIRGLGLELEQSNIISPKENKRTFESALRRGQQKSIDPAEIMKRKVMDNLVTQFVSDPSNKVGVDQYEDYLKKHGTPMSIMDKEFGAGQAITPELLAKSKSNSKLRASIEKTLGGISTIDLAQGMMTEAANASGDQKVSVTNFGMLALEMTRLGLFPSQKTNLNKSGH